MNRHQTPHGEKRDDFNDEERYQQHKMMRLSARLSIVMSTGGESLTHRQAQYDDQARVCEQRFPRWFERFKYGDAQD